jgi:hypothetical protein
VLGVCADGRGDAAFRSAVLSVVHPDISASEHNRKFRVASNRDAVIVSVPFCLRVSAVTDV